MPPMENRTSGGTPLAIQKVFFQSMVRWSDLSPAVSVIPLMIQLPLFKYRPWAASLTAGAGNENRPARWRGRRFFLRVIGGRPPTTVPEGWIVVPGSLVAGNAGPLG